MSVGTKLGLAAARAGLFLAYIVSGCFLAVHSFLLWRSWPWAEDSEMLLSPLVFAALMLLMLFATHTNVCRVLARAEAAEATEDSHRAP
jgi:hypothetical protein